MEICWQMTDSKKKKVNFSRIQKSISTNLWKLAIVLHKKHHAGIRKFQCAHAFLCGKLGTKLYMYVIQVSYYSMSQKR